MRIVPAIIVAIALLLVPLVWLGGRALLSVSTGGFDGPAVDSSARIEIQRLEFQIEALNQRIDALEKALNRAPTVAPRPQVEGEIPRDGPNQILDAYAQVTLIANRRGVNRTLSVATPGFLENLLGRPREVLSDDCDAMTNEKLKAMLVVEKVGPVRVQMLKPVVESLDRVLKKVRATDKDLYDRINTSGSLCVRRIRGSSSRLSSHSFGTAIDLNIDGQLDNFTDGKTQLGLIILADFFREEGWIWGAGFSREDSMHFEVSREKLEEWRRDGVI